MLVLDEKTVIEMTDVVNYKGSDTVMKLLKEKYDDVQERFFSHGLDVWFEHPKMKSGRIKGLTQETFPLIGTIKTNMGDRRLRFCRTRVVEPNGVIKYTPPTITIDTRKFKLGQTDIDYIIFLMAAFAPLRNGRIKMIDTLAEHKAKVVARGRSTMVAYHIFNEMGDLYSDSDKLKRFCLNWGVTIAGKVDDQLKNELADMIEGAEQRKDKEYGYDAFKDAIRSADPLFTIRVLVSQLIQENIIYYNDKLFQVKFKGNDETVFKVPLSRTHEWKKAMVEMLQKNQETLSNLMDLVKPKKKEAKVEKEPEPEEVHGQTQQPVTHDDNRPPLPDPLTRESIEALDYGVIMKLCKELDPQIKAKLNKQEAITMLLNWYIRDNKPRPE